MIFNINSYNQKNIDSYISILDKLGYITKFCMDEPYNYSYYTIELQELYDFQIIQNAVGYPLLVNNLNIEIYDRS
jgi:uncharacterized protein YqgQ